MASILNNSHTAGSNSYSPLPQDLLPKSKAPFSLYQFTKSNSKPLGLDTVYSCLLPTSTHPRPNQIPKSYTYTILIVPSLSALMLLFSLPLSSILSTAVREIPLKQNVESVYSSSVVLRISTAHNSRKAGHMTPNASLTIPCAHCLAAPQAPRLLTPLPGMFFPPDLHRPHAFKLIRSLLKCQLT